jgi:protein TonB
MENWEKDIFENRNKSYGSYQLRKKYNIYLFISFIIAVLLFIIPLYVILYKSHQNELTDDMPVSVSIDLSHPFDINLLLSEPPPPVKEKNKDISEKVSDVTKVLNETKSNENNEVTNKEDSSELKIKNRMQINKNMHQGNDTSSYIVVDELPQYIGGNDEFIKLIRKNLVIPDSLIKKHINGRIVIQVFISKSGDVLDVKLLSGLNSVIDNEALKALKITKKWYPAKREGKPIPFKYNIPIRI